MVCAATEELGQRCICWHLQARLIQKTVHLEPVHAGAPAATPDRTGPCTSSSPPGHAAVRRVGLSRCRNPGGGTNRVLPWMSTLHPFSLCTRQCHSFVFSLAPALLGSRGRGRLLRPFVAAPCLFPPPLVLRPSVASLRKRSQFSALSACLGPK